MITLITASLEEEGLAQLRQYGEVRYQPMAMTHRFLSGGMLVQELHGVDVFITEADQLSEQEIRELETVQIICSCRGNPVNIDVASATARSIPVIHAPGRNADAVADLSVMLMIMLGRKVLQAASLLHERDPSNDMMMMARIYFELRGTEMWNKTVGIVGMGAIGRKVTARLLPFGCKVIGYDPYVSQETMNSFGATKVELDELLRQADYISLHAVVTAGTKGMIGRREIEFMKETAYFINVARSALTDEMALYEALQQKRIAGAAFDVYDKEPLPADHPFLKLDNVILLPHIGGNTHEVNIHQTEIIVPDIIRLINGERPHNIMNPEVLDSFTFR